MVPTAKREPSFQLTAETRNPELEVDGFSSTVEENELTQDQQWAKLRLIVETADEIWG